MKKVIEFVLPGRRFSKFKLCLFKTLSSTVVNFEPKLWSLSWSFKFFKITRCYSHWPFNSRFSQEFKGEKLEAEANDRWAGNICSWDRNENQIKPYTAMPLTNQQLT